MFSWCENKVPDNSCFLLFFFYSFFFNPKERLAFKLLYENNCCGNSLEAPRRGASNEYPQHMFSWRNKIICGYPVRRILCFWFSESKAEAVHCSRCQRSTNNWTTDNKRSWKRIRHALSNSRKRLSYRQTDHNQHHRRGKILFQDDRCSHGKFYQEQLGKIWDLAGARKVAEVKLSEFDSAAV